MAKDTIKFGDKDYSLVPARLKKFRESNPRAEISTEHTVEVDGSVTFKARVIQDLSDEYSARATGSARYSAKEIEKAKAFEKLETISVGRALANLGYLNDGQVATTEEMLEFEDFKNEKLEHEIDESIKKIKKATSIEELKNIFLPLTAEVKSSEEVIKAKNVRKEELHNENSTDRTK